MELKTLIPLFVILDSLLYTGPERVGVLTNDNDNHRCMIQNPAVGVKIMFDAAQAYVLVSYGASFQEYFNVTEIRVGLVTEDGWMQSFPAECEIVVKSNSVPNVESQVYPDTFIVKY